MFHYFLASSIEITSKKTSETKVKIFIYLLIYTFYKLGFRENDSPKGFFVEKKKIHSSILLSFLTDSLLLLESLQKYF